MWSVPVLECPVLPDLQASARCPLTLPGYLALSLTFMSLLKDTFLCPQPSSGLTTAWAQRSISHEHVEECMCDFCVICQRQCPPVSGFKFHGNTGASSLASSPGPSAWMSDRPLENPMGMPSRCLRMERPEIQIPGPAAGRCAPCTALGVGWVGIPVLRWHCCRATIHWLLSRSHAGQSSPLAPPQNISHIPVAF